MRREVNDVLLGDGSHRYLVRIYDEPSIAGTRDAHIRFRTFWRELGDNHELMQCGFYQPDRIRVDHDGNCWVAEIEANYKEEL